MHELSLAESMMELICSAAVTQKFSCVRVVWLEVGCMAGVEPDALRFCFDAVARGTVAEGARLEIVEIAGSGACADCGSVHPVRGLLDCCPQCGGDAVHVSGGAGMRVKELDVL
jgi:hydrogenase nickel incorporation protein HypA/HybF